MLESDEELFEDEPIEYIRRDLEGSDSETRRRAATELVRGLLDQYPTDVTAIITNYIQHYLQRYNTNVAENWKDKDAAMFLLTSIAAKSSGSQVCLHSGHWVVTHFGIHVLISLPSNPFRILPTFQVRSH